ncbi:hypothetical protein FisN_9Lh370 [Fistulifera solaris]|uniref:Serine protease n=1 Tax=Fistulifera solaris TaxID=1519565 RepID=A0A1Z5KL52_FISSO|nr:hypothetical protein FisN_9Lh370 [Fistulifera solaris]|eukprot:GAX27050.1 hypothetical protein FisN_9Lh370 [Fistulifera solaris]
MLKLSNNLVLAAYLILAFSFAGVVAQYNCDAGCSLDSAIMGGPVCGEDLLTYVNGCVASCQGVRKFTSGPCSGDADRIAMPDFSGNSEIITRAIMNRFAKENFRFVTKEIEFSTEPIVEEGSAEDEFNIFSPLQESATKSIVRVTHEGYKFIAKASSSTKMTSTQPYRGVVEDTSSNLRHRKLDVIGPDTRSVIGNTSVFPYRTIGAVDYNNPTLCTATMISRRSGLTAGHCAYSYSSKTWRPMKKIAPGRYIDLTQPDKTAEPFGTWDVDYVTVMQAYIANRSRTADIAVVTYKPRNETRYTCRDSTQVYPGDIVGYLGIDLVAGTDTSVTDTRLQTMTLTGYPYDFDEQMVTSGRCSDPPQSYGPNYILHYCDTEGGSSGTGLLTTENQILGVHNMGFGSANGAVVFSRINFDFVYQGAGLANQEPLNCQLRSTFCPCAQYTNNRRSRVRCWIRNLAACLPSLQSRV